MKKIRNLFLLAALFVALVTLFSDKYMLSHGLIRLHVVGASDSQEDQARKLRVRDAVLEAVEALARKETVTDAKAFLSENLRQLESAANALLAAEGCADRATVTLCREAFPIRHYDTFTLPSGVYDSLRVTIGEGEGRNWWCVVFPKLCLGATGEEFRATAVSAGFSDTLTDTLSGEEGYEISFFLLDCLGRLENFFHFR